MDDTGWTQLRPELDRRLDAALTHRLTTVIAATGYGKTIALSGWARAVRAVYYRIGPADRDLGTFVAGVITALRLRMPAGSPTVTGVDAPLGPDAIIDESARPAALAGAVVDALDEVTGSVVLVLDDVTEIVDAPGPVRFIDTLVRTAPPHLHLVVAGRDALPFPIARLRQVQDVLEFDAKDLALTVGETAAWLEHRIGPSAVGLAARLHGATGGWPAATHAAIDAMTTANPTEWPRLASDVSQASAGLHALTRQVFDDLPPETRRLLRAATVVPVVTADLAEVLGAPPDAVSTIVSRGMFLEEHTDGYGLTTTSHQVLCAHAPLDDHAAHEIATVAAQWYVDQGRPALAVRTALAANHTELIASLLATHGRRLVDHPDDLLSALDRIGGPCADVDQDPHHVRLAGLAHFNRGDWDQARTTLAEALEIGETDASVAYRIGLIDHLRGDLATALEMYQRGSAAGHPPADAVMCAAMAASVLWLRGDRKGSAALAGRARDQAVRLGDHRALASAHTALAMVAAYDGDTRANDAHYLRALEHATTAGDVAQQIRIRCNLASHRHEEGSFDAALAELEIAIGLCDLTGFAPWSALARSNRAESLIRLGRLEEAAVDAGDAVQRWEAMGSRLVAYGLTRQAQIQVLRGHSTSAADTFRRAVDLAEQAGDSQALGQALTGLAELRVRDDPAEAAALAKRAIDNHVGTSIVSAYLAAARAARACDRPSEARELVDRAEAEALRRDEKASLARITELRAEFDGDPTLADAAVRQWSATGDPIGLGRAELIRAGLGDPSDAAVAVEVRARLHAVGCRALDDEIDALIARAAPAIGPRVVVQTLGSFRVLREGTPIPTAAWQSRKARDLLKVLITRRGRPVPRDHLVEILWPDTSAADEAAAFKRLNVMVSTLRAVLDPDHARPPDHIVASVDGALRLNIDHVTVDVLDFLDQVGEAVRLDRAGRFAEALERWRTAESAYTGDFCEEDRYADWATGLREEARLAYAQAAARIADWEAEQGHDEQAARYWLRLLERDPFDERAHLSLVRTLDHAGRRGDARRRYQAYADLMRELDIEPSPHPA